MTISVRIETVAVPGGSFTMGSAQGRPDERPAHDVRVGGFFLGRTPVTRGQYEPFLAAGSAAAPPWWSEPAFGDSRQPVVGVTWFDAIAFTEWLGEAVGGRWRLPTEAEWERAARGGLEGAPTAWGTSVPDGELPEGPLAAPWAAGRGRPNGYGLLDMGTIVHEWCQDWYRADYYAVSPETDPRGPDEGERRASRGGSWRHHVRWSPPSARSSLPPAFRYADYGFRVLREVGT
ncbi:MAG TPA: SUMF1/EgtB/PvdO family nonheme iron enzyme [Vicinamibacteria bacterium]|nr:SUMF1/EgtB/PvdO family nonheme iron enzyme [Vicinamibacteria bacterium]